MLPIPLSATMPGPLTTGLGYGRFRLSKPAVLRALLILVLLAGLAAAEAAETKTITLLGTSDVHGFCVPWDYSTDTAFPGGLAKVATVVKRLRASGAVLLVVDAGDLIQGNAAETFRNEAVNPLVCALNLIGYDFWVPGNHEFNFGPEVLLRALSGFRGQALGGNIYTASPAARLLPATAIIEREGVRLGIVGLTTPMIQTFEAGTHNLDGLEIRSPVPELRAAIGELKGRVDALVGVMHMGEGNENNVPETGVTDLLSAAPGLDVVVAGHNHQRLAGKEIRGALVVEPYVNAQNLSRVDLVFTKTARGWQLTGKSAQLLGLADEAADPALTSFYEPYHHRLRAAANEVIGRVVGGDMVASGAVPGIPTVQVSDSPLMTLFHEACRHWTQADVVALHTDNDAARMDQGEIRRVDVARNYTYALGEITTYRFTTEDLKAYLEWSGAFFNTLRPGDVTCSFNPARRASKYCTNDQFGGIDYTLDLSRPPGERVRDLRRSGGGPLRPGQTLVIGLNAYRLNQLVARGGCLEGRTFAPLADTKARFGEEDGSVRGLIIRYIREVKRGVVEATCDRNWSLTGFDPALDRERKIVERLLREGVITVPASGSYGNIESINVTGLVATDAAGFDACRRTHEAALASATTPDLQARERRALELLKALKTF